MFPSLVIASRKEIYGAILPSPLGLLYSTGQQLNALLKKSLHSLLSVAFTSYTELQERGPEFEEWVRVKGGRKDNELSELTHAFRGTCLTSLPEFMDNTKVRVIGWSLSTWMLTFSLCRLGVVNLARPQNPQMESAE